MTSRNERPPEPRPRADPVPRAAAWLGGAGLIPFAAGAALCWLFPDDILPQQLLGAYGAVILAFMGGCRWGFAAAGMGRGPTWVALGVSVMPALLGWVALFTQPPTPLIALAAGFAVLLAADIRLTRAGGAPAWWTRLRWPLTAGAVASLLLGALGSAAV